ncbi:hypothetical protein HK100_003106, partial [Physocladia obscura]
MEKDPKDNRNADDKVLAGPCPKDSASWSKRLTFGWVDSLFQKGSKQPLVLSDLWRIPMHLKCDSVSDELLVVWESQVNIFKEQQKVEGALPYTVDGTILRNTLWIMCFKQVFRLGFLKVFSDLCNLFSPFLVQYIIIYVQQKSTTPTAIGIGYAIGLFALQVAATLALNQFTQELAIIAIAMRTAIWGNIYRKSVKLSSSARQRFDAGNVINMVSTDAARIELFFNQINFIWTLPIAVLINMIFLIHSLGVSALVGIAVIFLALPVQTVLFRKMKTIRRDQAPITDRRVKKTTEILNGIRVIKLFSWETSFVKAIAEIRKAELTQVLRRAIFQSFLMTQAQALPIITACVSFITYSFLNPLDPAYIFSSLAWFNQLRQPIFQLPTILNTWAEFNIAMVRIEGLLLATELDPRGKPVDSDTEHAIVVKNGSFDWSGPVYIDGVLPAPEVQKKVKKVKTGGKSKVAKNSSSATNSTASTLTGINITIPKGALVGIVGAVGSGKSSLLNALVGEMRQIGGDVEFSGTISYAPQTPWIQNASVRDNVIFGAPLDLDRYIRSLHDSALLPDLRILQDADQTSIGERGINLSGGQKARVNLARLMYSKTDIVFLDDPLSAVDAHVARHLFDYAIKGSLKSRTRLLVTHQLHFLPECDYIIFMKDGIILEQGLYRELIDANGAFANMIRSHGSEEATNSDSDSEIDFSGALAEIKAIVTAPKATHNIMSIEDQETGSVKSAVWRRYMQAAGGKMFLAQLSVLVLLVQCTRIGNDLWLTAWTSKTFDISNLGYIGVYSGLGIGVALSLFFYALFFGVKGTRAAKMLHEAALARVLRCPVFFFDTTPLGRILNRFSRDVDAVDNSISFNFRQLVQQLSIVFSTFCVMCYAIPVFTAPVVPALGVYFYVQNVYRKTARELKRLDSTTKSP